MVSKQLKIWIDQNNVDDYDEIMAKYRQLLDNSD